MTTAARPTWAPAKGGQEQGGARMFGASQKFSARDLASHTVLKTRKEGQGTVEELRKKDLKDELEDLERKHFGSGKDVDRKGSGGSSVKLLGSSKDAENLGPDKAALKSVDADDSDEEAESDADKSDDDEDDDTAELLAELERIKKEKAAEKLRKEQQMQQEDAKAKEAEMMRGNPLLNPSSTSFSVKRRWDDDVVFKNQARGEPKQVKRFINDTIRNDFHRKFLHKYMK